MRYGSVCSGIEAASSAWHPLGWTPVFFSEIDAFPNAVLKRHYPNVPNYGDMTKFKEWPHESIDLLVGGTPCQSFSVAGLRKGLADPRGNLALVFLAIVDRLRPNWVVWENVPGVLSSEGGRDFGSFVGGLGQLGYGWAYRILDAQFFGVPQRRRRVFVVGHLGDWRCAAAVLFERDSLQGNPPPSREARKGTPDGIAHSLRGRSNDSHREDSATYIPEVSPAIKSRDFKGPSSDGDGDGAPLLVTPEPGYIHPRQIRNSQSSNQVGIKPYAQVTDALTSEGPGAILTGDVPDVTHALKGDGYDGSEDGTGRGTPIIVHSLDSHDLAQPLGAKDNGNGVLAFDTTQVTSKANRSDPKVGGPCHPLAAGAHAPAVAMQEGQSGCREYGTAGTLRANGPGHDPVGTRVRAGMSVRRLTPRECERLQGFPDNYTDVPYRKKPASDGPRYKALGNSMAVPVMGWIGQRIESVSAIPTQAEQLRKS